MVITKPVDTYTTQFAKSASTGAHLATVTVWFDRTAGSEIDIARLILTNVLVKATTLRFPSGGAAQEVVTLNVRRESITYWPQKPDGSLGTAMVYCWDLVSNVAC